MYKNSQMTGFKQWTSGAVKQPLCQLSHNHRGLTKTFFINFRDNDFAHIRIHNSAKHPFQVCWNKLQQRFHLDYLETWNISRNKSMCGSKKNFFCAGKRLLNENCFFRLSMLPVIFTSHFGISVLNSCYKQLL